MYEDALYAVSPASGTVLARIPRLEGDAWPSCVSDEYGPYALSVWERGRIALLDGSTGEIVARYDGPTAMAWGEPPDLFLKIADGHGRLHVAREVGWASAREGRRPTTA